MNDEHLANARREAEEALKRAKARKNWAQRLAEGWLEARNDNGFREVLRGLPPVAGEGR